MSKRNRAYRSSVFADLFGDDEVVGEKNFLALYNAINDTDLKMEDVSLRRIEIDQAVYRTYSCDVSFEINGSTVVLFEHQSTENENMPLRCLSYIARLYDSMVPAAKRYAKRRQRIPSPKFYVFYNGSSEIPAESEMNLRDAFTGDSGSGDLDLRVHMYRINGDENLPIVDKCGILKEYCQFVEIAKEYSVSGDSDSYEMAVNESMRRGVLKEYLLRKGTEALNMFYGEYDYETDIKVQREEAMEEGRARGMEEGLTRGKEEVVWNMLALGMTLEQIAVYTGIGTDELNMLKERRL